MEKRASVMTVRRRHLVKAVARKVCKLAKMVVGVAVLGRPFRQQKSATAMTTIAMDKSMKNGRTLVGLVL
jgi:hypothetical protein